MKMTKELFAFCVRKMQKAGMTLAAIAVALGVLVSDVQAALLDTNLTAGITEVNTTLTTGVGASTIYWVVGLSLGLTVLAIIVAKTKKGARV